VQGERQHAVLGRGREHGDPVGARGVHHDLAGPEAARGGQAADEARQHVVGDGEQGEIGAGHDLVGLSQAGMSLEEIFLHLTTTEPVQGDVTPMTGERNA
jgi:hypothetical protein